MNSGNICHMHPHYHIGLPAWAYPGWRDCYFRSHPSALASYAQVFNTVEGNTTFYGIPDQKTIDSWCTHLSGTDLQICFKLPRTVTHEKTVRYRDLHVFFDRILPLDKHLGPVLLQFPATLGPQHLGLLETLFKQLPTHCRYVVEVRHPEFFSRPETLEPLLSTFGYGRVMMDTRAVFQGDRQHPEVTNALHDKPNVPVLKRVYNQLVFVRLLLHPDTTNNTQYINQWVSRISQALREGWDCYVMIHCPNNQHCPEFARQFHEALCQRMAMTNDGDCLLPLPTWPVPQQTELLS